MKVGFWEDIMFYNREDAGEKLAAELLSKYQGKTDLIVLAIPRGGVVLGKIIADKLNSPLDIIITRKIGAPDNPEFAIGAVAEKGEPLLDEEIIGNYGITPDYLDREISIQKEEIKRRINLYRQGGEKINIKNKSVILVDDGAATGLNMLVAIKYLKTLGPSQIIAAVPVASLNTIEEIKKIADDSICLEMPRDFYAIGQFYTDFPQVSDNEVIELLK